MQKMWKMLCDCVQYVADAVLTCKLYCPVKSVSVRIPYLNYCETISIVHQTNRYCAAIANAVRTLVTVRSETQQKSKQV